MKRCLTLGCGVTIAKGETWCSRCRTARAEEQKRLALAQLHTSRKRKTP